MREKSKRKRERESDRGLEDIGGCWPRGGGKEKQANQANGEEGRERELEGSNRTSKLNVEIRVECLVR